MDNRIRMEKQSALGEGRVWRTVMGACAALALGLSLTLTASAQSLSPAQIQQFKSLSPSEQQRLARQFGVELPRSAGAASEETALAPTITRQPPSSADSGVETPAEPTRVDGLPLFGYDLLAGFPSSFSPIGDLPVPSDYIVGPGDEILVQLYGKENESYRLTVGRDGSIDFPRLGPIAVAGKAFAQLRDELTLRIKKQIIGAEVAVGMGELRLMQVYVLGDARRPGAYNLSSLATATQALIAAGGIAETGSLRQVEVRRGKQLLARLDLYDLLVKGDRSGDLRLQSGDAVFVRPVGPRVAVEGAVLRPAIYEAAAATTLGEIVDAAGGAGAEAYLGQVRVERRGDSGREVFTRDLSSERGRAFRLRAGDRVQVPERARRYAAAITLSGAFLSPGRHEYAPGMRVADLLGRDGAGLRHDADTAQALLVREGDGGRLTVRYLSLAQLLEHPDGDANLALQPRDELIVLPGTGFDRCSAEDMLQQRKAQRALDRQRWQALQRAVNSAAAAEPGEARGVTAGAGRDSSPADAQASQAEGDRFHCGPLARFADDEELPGEGRAGHEPDGEQSTTRLLQQQEEEALVLLGEERTALLAPVLEKIRLQTGSGDTQAIVEIRGEVSFPGVYPYDPALALEDLVAVAGGLRESSYRRQAELTRLQRSADGDLTLAHQQLSLGGEDWRQLRLLPRDRINVFRHPDWRNDLTVSIGGEVRFPGRYTIARGESVGDVVRRAGGFTDFAFPGGAVLSRTSLKQREQRELDRLRERLKEQVATLSLQKSSIGGGLSVSPSEALKVVDELDEAEALGRLVISLPAAMAGNPDHNIVLEDGDELYVPARSNTVSIVGEVQYPSSHVFEDGLSYKDYLERAGGLRERADKKRIYVIRANGQVMVPRNSWFGARIAEGDTIVVPIDADYTDRLTLFSTVTQILYQLGIAYDVIKD